MHLSKTSGYAVHALICIGHAEGQPCFVRDIAQCTGLKKPYLAKIINLLVHRGFLVAKRGYRGGVALARPAEQISLLQVVQAMEGEVWKHLCLFGLEECPGLSQCPAHAAWRETQDRIETLLRASNLAQIIKAKQPSPHAGHSAVMVPSASFDWPLRSPSGSSLRSMAIDAPKVPARQPMLSRAG